MPIEPVKIPQNVHIEDRIIGSITLRQIIMMAIGGGFSYALYSSLLKAYGTVSLPVTIMVWIPAVVMAAFAMVKVNDLSMLRICLLLMERTQKPSRRVWTPRQGLTINIRLLSSSQQRKQTTADKTNTPAGHKIQELSSVVDEAFVEDSPLIKMAAPLPEEQSDDTDQEADPLDPLQDIDSVSDKRPNLPVDPNRIAVDDAHHDDQPGLSDLSVFRDIFPSNNH